MKRGLSDTVIETVVDTTTRNQLRRLFPKEEFDLRHSKLRAAMKDAKLDAVVAFSQVNIFWASG